MCTLHRLRPSKCGNASLGGGLSNSERSIIVEAAASKLAELLDILYIDHKNDHNTRETPHRVARMLVDDIMRGRFSRPPALTEFENVGEFDQLIVMGPIDVRSTCAHHLMPIYGEAFIGVLPSTTGKIIGLSKYDRIVDYFSGRLQIQEELVQQISQFILDKTTPLGLAVRISAVHMCKTHRGVYASHSSKMITGAYFGALNNRQLKSQFLRELALIDPTHRTPSRARSGKLRPNTG
jgi:GTP cyclohydrolase I